MRTTCGFFCQELTKEQRFALALMLGLGLFTDFPLSISEMLDKARTMHREMTNSHTVLAHNTSSLMRDWNILTFSCRTIRYSVFPLRNTFQFSPDACCIHILKCFQTMQFTPSLQRAIQKNCLQGQDILNSQ